MTESEWLACDEAKQLLKFFRGQASDRKLRLFAAACCARVEHHFIDPCQRLAVRLIEQYADGLASSREILDAEIAVKRFDLLYFEDNLSGDEVAYRAACVVSQAMTERPLEQLSTGPSPHWLDDVIWGAASAAGYAAIEAAEGAGNHYDDWDRHNGLRRAIHLEDSLLAAYFRDIFGNPFRPVTLDPRWLTSTVVEVAAALYAEKDFGRLPILADALQDAGCDDEQMIIHCQSKGPHIRGCWAVDALLLQK